MNIESENQAVTDPDFGFNLTSGPSKAYANISDGKSKMYFSRVTSDPHHLISRMREIWKGLSNGLIAEGRFRFELAENSLSQLLCRPDCGVPVLDSAFFHIWCVVLACPA